MAPPSSSPTAVLISEVGPRDGLQSVKATMVTADKLRWIDALHAATSWRVDHIDALEVPELHAQRCLVWMCRTIGTP